MVAYSFKGRFVAPICVGLGIDIPPRRGFVIAAGLKIEPKRQTIRANGRRRHARPGETLQLYRGMRTKQCFLIGEARCIDVERMIIWVGAPNVIAIERSKAMLDRPQMEQFARDDGFADLAEMTAFWRIEHPGEKFEGLLIRWEPIHG